MNWDIILENEKCGCSSRVEHLLAKQKVEGSNLFIRSIYRIVMKVYVKKNHPKVLKIMVYDEYTIETNFEQVLEELAKSWTHANFIMRCWENGTVGAEWWQ